MALRGHEVVCFCLSAHTPSTRYAELQSSNGRSRHPRQKNGCGWKCRNCESSQRNYGSRSSESISKGVTRLMDGGSEA